MKILLPIKCANGSSVFGECLMMDKYGNTYQCIDNAYHPNPGTAATGYDEIERTVDWIFSNIKEVPNSRTIYKYLVQWVRHQVAVELDSDPEAPLEDVLFNVMFCDLYQPCNLCIDEITKAYDECNRYVDTLESYLEIDIESVCEAIVTWLNENFLRIRAGGKLNPQGTDSIYFRISSHGFDWRSNIEDFLWETFKDIESMPKYIWVGHDAETNPPEVTLFEGNAEDLVDNYDGLVAETTHISPKKTKLS